MNRYPPLITQLPPLTHRSERGPYALKKTKHSTYEHSSSCDPTSLQKRRVFFFDRSSRKTKTVFSHHSHIVCYYNQATTRPRRVVPVWNAKTTSEHALGVAVKKIGEWIFSS
ncbi:hypothetical protein EVAR_97534_1 [Eumeta japonica]|uniref:Uncharacterized protein n=1 Tax=Eumeta variegata TaxID=151549 RepID=A0A4C1WPQ5_EUMVA|nr:hypothetical protein EVAR_97534_1 [Eumeta japonica]